MISNEEAQELHGRIGAALENLNHMPSGYKVTLVKAELDPILNRALELAALLVADTMEGRDPDPSPVSHDPCIQGTIEIGGRKSEFLFLLDRGDVGFSQWGADNETLWERVGLLDAMSITAKEWWLDNKPEESDDE